MQLLDVAGDGPGVLLCSAVKSGDFLVERCLQTGLGPTCLLTSVELHGDDGIIDADFLHSHGTIRCTEMRIGGFGLRFCHDQTPFSLPLGDGLECTSVG